MVWCVQVEVWEDGEADSHVGERGQWGTEQPWEGECSAVGEI